MRKVVMIVFAAALVSIACRSFSDTVNWHSDTALTTSGVDVYDVDSNFVPQTSLWAVRILLSSNSNEVFSATGGQWSDVGADGSFYQAFSYNSVGNPFNGQAIFTRIYNNSNWMDATYQADVGFTTINWPSATPPSPANTYYYNIGVVSGGLVGSGGSWYAVPEPATMGLFGLGAIGTWLIRRKKKLSA